MWLEMDRVAVFALLGDIMDGLSEPLDVVGVDPGHGNTTIEGEVD